MLTSNIEDEIKKPEAPEQKRSRPRKVKTEKIDGKTMRKIHRRRRRRAIKDFFSKALSFLYLLIQIAVVCAIGFLIVLSFGQRIDNSGEAMAPTLQNGEVVLVNRLVYNVFRPNRGDVIAFWPNGNTNASLSIRRVVGLPGETIQISEGRILINDEEIIVPGLEITDLDFSGLAEEPLLIDDGEFFVMGDNYQRSSDSRMADLGMVERDHIDGKIWFAISEDFGFVK